MDHRLLSLGTFSLLQASASIGGRADRQILPSLVPLRINRNVVPVILALLLPIIAFLVIGRTVEITKVEEALTKRGAADFAAGPGVGISTFPASHL